MRFACLLGVFLLTIHCCFCRVNDPLIHLPPIIISPKKLLPPSSNLLHRHIYPSRHPLSHRYRSAFDESAPSSRKHSLLQTTDLQHSGQCTQPKLTEREFRVYAKDRQPLRPSGGKFHRILHKTFALPPILTLPESRNFPPRSYQNVESRRKTKHSVKPATMLDAVHADQDRDLMTDVDFKTWKPNPALVTTVMTTTTTKATTTTSTQPTTATTVKVTVPTLPVIKIPTVKPKTNSNAKTKGNAKDASTKNKKSHGPTKVPQSFSEVPAMKEQGKEGETLRLTCPSTGAETFPKGAYYMWTSPEKLPLRIGQSGSRHIVQPNGGLIIQSLSTVDEGKYVCSLVVGHQAIRNGSVYVSIEDCTMAPCMNGGECEDLDGKQGSKLFCRCLDSYEGRYCETKKNLWLLLVPIIGSGVVVLAIIAVIVKFTCFWKKKVVPSTLPPSVGDPQTSSDKEKASLSDPDRAVRKSQAGHTQSLPGGTVIPIPSYQPKPQLRTTPSGYLPRYDVTAQHGGPAYWPDRRFSYTKFRDGVVTQTGHPEDYGQASMYDPKTPWQYEEEGTQTGPEYTEEHESLIAPPPQFVAGHAVHPDWSQVEVAGPNGEYRTDLSASFHDLATPVGEYRQSTVRPRISHPYLPYHPYHGQAGQTSIQTTVAPQSGYQNRW